MFTLFAFYGGDGGDVGYVTDSLDIYVDTTDASSYTSGSSTLLDLSGNGRDVTLANTASITYDATSGSLATTGNSNGGYLYYQATQQPYPAEYTVEFGINVGSLGLRWDSRESAGYALTQTSATLYGVADYPFPSGSILSTNETAIIAVVFTATDLTVYKNGVEIDTRSYGSTRGNTSGQDIPYFTAIGGQDPSGTSVAVSATKPMNNFWYHRVYGKALSPAEIEQNYNYNANLIPGLSPLPSYDVDAQAYIDEVTTQGGTLSSSEQDAINTFYETLKTNSIYTKLHVFYPFLGGTATSNAVEGKNPGGAYDITFNGTWTHSNTTGSYCTQTAGNYADTNFNLSSSADVTSDFAFGVYTSGISGTGNGYHGVGNGASNYVLLGTVDSRTSYQFYSGGNNQRVVDKTGDWNSGVHFFQSRVASNDVFGGYADAAGGDTITTGSSATGTAPSVFDATLWFGSNNGNDIELGGEMRFGWAAQGLNFSELQTLSTAINDLQTAFSRNYWS